MYDWALTQDTIDFFVSEYFRKVLDFNHLAIAKAPDHWKIENFGNIRELHISKKLGYPDLTKSRNVVGFSPAGTDYYVHLGPDTLTELYFTHRKPNTPYLYSANGTVVSFNKGNGDTQLQLNGHMPLHFTMANMDHCKLSTHRGLLQGKQTSDGMTTYSLNVKDSNALTIRCQN